MKLEDQICSLDLAKRLKDFGVKQESLYIYGNTSIIPRSSIMGWDKHELFMPHVIAAFTSSELMELLPRIIDTKKGEPFNNFRFNLTRSLIIENSEPKATFLVNYICDTIDLSNDVDVALFPMQLLRHNIYDQTLANTLAKTLIHLIKNGLVLTDNKDNTPKCPICSHVMMEKKYCDYCAMETLK